MIWAVAESPGASGNQASKVELARELHDPGVPCCQDFSKIRTGVRGRRVAEIRMVRAVEHLPANFKLAGFADVEVLEQAGIEVLEARPGHDVAAAGAEGAQRGRRKGSGVEVFLYPIGVGFIVVGLYGANAVAPVEPHAREAAIRSGRTTKGNAGLQGQDAVHGPTAQYRVLHSVGTTENGQVPDERVEEAMLDVEAGQAFVEIPVPGIGRLASQAAVAVIGFLVDGRE